MKDTIAAIATAPGRGGVAVIRVSGPESWSIAAQLTDQRSEVKGQSVVVRKLSTLNRSFIDEALVLFFKGPHSYTGEDVVEFQCHGGTVTPRRVLEACYAAGARPARRGEFTERAFLNGKLDYDQAESVLDLIDAKTSRAADAALEGLSGRKQRECGALYDEALALSTIVEHALDVDEEELPEGFLAGIDARRAALHLNLCEAICRAREGKILRTGALVVLAGPPNAGKSSLMNALLEENRAIVSDTPGTTRDTIEEWLDLDGWPIRLVDTAGLRETDETIDAEGVRRSEELMAKANLILWLGPSTLPPFHPSPLPLLHLHPKCDLGRGPGLNVSAKTGEGLDDLKKEIVSRLAERVASASEESSDEAVAAFQAAAALLAEPQPDLVLAGNAFRQAAESLGSLVGATYSADLLDNLFSRFCVGK